jgi:hypothetical protein
VKSERSFSTRWCMKTKRELWWNNLTAFFRKFWCLKIFSYALLL